jgi:type I restriction enzyme M protein
MANPPYGVTWKKDKNFIENEALNPAGRFYAGTPRTSDGQLLFLQHMISKMDKVNGSRIGVVTNGSPLFTGDAGSGESDIRKWIIENDWLECIIALPKDLFYNTGINTYIWFLTNKKAPNRKGKVQLINGICTLQQKEFGQQA